MPNSIGVNGLELATQAELIEYYTEQYQEIYGDDINLDPDSPDGQMMMIQIQSILDLQDLLRQIYNSFDPDNAVGAVLDQRVAINGIQRQAGTYTVTNVTITTTQAVNLYGVDQVVEPIYTVADNAGTQWQLRNTISIPSAGSYALEFQAALPGAVLTTPNTITVPVSIVLGVASINNPTTYTTLGINEESDADLKIRRQRSVSLSSQGYLQGLLAALENITGVTSAFVHENVTGSTDSDGIPSHSIWVIVAGSASAADIANAIYQKRNAGCGMKGSQTYNITQSDGSAFTIKWDNVTPEDLFIKFTTTSLDGTTPVDIAAIREGLVTSFAPGVYEKVNVNELATQVQDIDPNCLVTSPGFSDSASGSYSNTKTPTAKNNQFAVSEENIIILPMQLTPPTYAMAAGGATHTFVGLGGYGTLTYSKVSGNGSINSSTGVFTSGAAGTTVLRVTDSLGNTADATVTVS